MGLGLRICAHVRLINELSYQVPWVTFEWVDSWLGWDPTGIDPS